MKKIILFLNAVFLLLCCNKEQSAPPIPQNPTAAKLVFPYQDYLCNVGTNITPTESTVLFEWEESEHTDSYELVLKNVTTGIFTSYTTADTKMPVVIERNTAFKWYVISKSGSVSDTALSATWKFFNAGAAVESYVPFPAEIVSPAMASTITITDNAVTLGWTGSDVDNDIVGYDVYFGKTADPPIIETDIEESILENVPVEPDTIYYWRIITKDATGNSSDSGVFQFKIS